MNVKGRTSLDGSGWAAGLRKMEAGTKGAAGRMAASMAGMVGGLFAVTALRSATMRMVAHADAIDKMAKRMESSTDTAQKFDFAASQNGATVEMVERSFMKTAQAMEGAKQGLNTYVRAFAAFGISMQQIKTSTPEEIFLQIADAIEKAGGALDKAKSLQDIMGRGGRQLVPAFVSGFAATAESAPDPIDADTIKNLANFNDELDRLKREALPLAAEAVGRLADVFSAMQEGTGGKKATLGERAGNLAGNMSIHGGLAALSMVPGVGPIAVEAFRRNPQYFGNNETDIQPFIDELNSHKISIGQNPFTTKAKQDFTSGILGFNTNPMIGPQMPEAAAAGALSFTKPSLALNALQRIGAAVSQSADPIAIEKDNNVLLKRIANNTKDIARNSE
jgi:hypothetical protein